MQWSDTRWHCMWDGSAIRFRLLPCPRSEAWTGEGQGTAERGPEPAYQSRHASACDTAPSLRSVDAIQVELERTVFDTLQQSNSAQRNRTLGYLLGPALRALEVGEIESRLEALEAIVGRAPRNVS